MLRRAVGRLAMLVAGLALVFARVPAAEARTGSCLVPGVEQPCTIWTARVTSVIDGDTFRVDVDRDGTHKRVRVRITGVQAMERGECHAAEATARLKELIAGSGRRVRLAAQDASSSSGARRRRAVAVRVGGRWTDVGGILIAEGHALWLPNPTEYVWNAEYSRLAEEAAPRARNLWDPAYCGAGPSAASPLSAIVNADADGSDRDLVNGEWVRVRNLDPIDEVHLGGWWLRDSALNLYRFPWWTTLAPGDYLTVYAGTGVDTWTELFWGRQRPLFENGTRGERAMGDGAYLFDPQGDLRAWMTYPCRLDCGDPYRGAVELAATAIGPESVTVRNVARAAVDLHGYRLQSPPYVYSFPPGSVVPPGEELRVVVTGDPAEDTTLEKGWGEPGPILDNRGDKVRLTSLRGVVLDCYAFGAASC